MVTSRADHDLARPVHFAKKIDLEPCDHELRVDRHWDPPRIVQELHARVLAADGKHGIGDVTIAVGVGEAQLLRRVQGIVLEARTLVDVRSVRQ
mgnify:CR=1 FL=1